MYKSYIKKALLRAIRFKDDFETYKFICKELDILNVADTEKEYHNIKKFGISLNSKESRQILFIGDYLANGGNGDFYVIREDFMKENYRLLEDEKPDPGIEKVLCGIQDGSMFKIPVSERTAKEMCVGIETVVGYGSVYEMNERVAYDALDAHYKKDRIDVALPEGCIAFGGGCFVNSKGTDDVAVLMPTSLRYFDKGKGRFVGVSKDGLKGVPMKGKITFPKDFKSDDITDIIGAWTKSICELQPIEKEPSVDLFRISISILNNSLVFKYYYTDKDYKVTARNFMVDCLNKIDKEKITGTTGDNNKDLLISADETYIRLVQYINEVVKFARENLIELPPFENAVIDLILGPNESIHEMSLVGDITLHVYNIEKLLELVNEGE